MKSTFKRINNNVITTKRTLNFTIIQEFENQPLPDSIYDIKSSSSTIKENTTFHMLTNEFTISTKDNHEDNNNEDPHKEQTTYQRS